jgi:pyruvate dehydrogenase complex dehydrogenase (E1) component
VKLTWQAVELRRIEVLRGGELAALIAQCENGTWDAVICKKGKVLGEHLGGFKSEARAIMAVEQWLDPQ